MAATKSARITDTQRQEVAARLRLSATRLARLLRQQSDTGLTPSQLSALSTIEREGTLTLGRLAELERVAPPSITKAVTKLEDARLVARQGNPDDRRFWLVSATPEGRALVREIHRRKDVWLAEQLGELDDGDVAKLAKALDVLDRLTQAEG
jgi:DNA-binding MarR family transcriptional regulator